MNQIIIQNRNCGFFSDFNTIVGSLNYIKKNNIQNFYFVWENVFYQEKKYNMFDEYFYKQNPYEYFEDSLTNTAVDLGWKTIEAAEALLKTKGDIFGFEELHQTLKHFNYFENPIFKQIKNKTFIKPKTIGIHVRQTDHWGHGQLLPIQYYFQKLEEKLNQYENIFLATDEVRVVDEFMKRYGNRVYINQDIVRSDNHIPIHTGKYINYKEKLAEDVLLDAISLSLCDETIITSSNISHYIFIINPNLKYFKIDNHIFYQ